MYRDPARTHFYEKLRQRGFRLFAHIFTLKVIIRAAQLAGIGLGRGILTLPVLVWLALLGALHCSKTFADILGLALAIIRADPSWKSSPFKRTLDTRRPHPSRSRQKRRQKRKSRRQAQKQQRRRNRTSKSRKTRARTSTKQQNTAKPKPKPTTAKTKPAPAKPATAKPKTKPRRPANHDPHGPTDRWTVSQEAFVQARQKLPWGFWFWLIFLVAEDFQRQYPQYVLWNGFRLLAMDGTLVNLEHWQALAHSFGTASTRNGPGCPQARLLMIEFPLSRMPWLCYLAPRTVAESTIAAMLMGLLRRNDLLLMDRGFFCYRLFWDIQKRGAFFATRLKGGINFKQVRRLGPDDEVVRWTPSSRTRGKTLAESIELRVVKYQVKGYRPSAVVTNVLDENKISRDDWVRMAVVDEAGRVLEPGLYHRRWEIETSYRELKVTQGMEGNLRSRKPGGIRYEIGGHLILYQGMRYLMAEAAAQAGMKDPLRLSFKAALEEVRDEASIAVRASAQFVKREIRRRMMERMVSHLVPLRPGRSYQRRGSSSDNKYGKSGKSRSRKKASAKKKSRRSTTAPPTGPPNTTASSPL